MEFYYSFPGVKGVQSNKTYYITMLPLKMISKLFPEEEVYVEPEFRAQRKLNTSRIPVISRYILENRDSYVFSALAASIDGDFHFEAVDKASDIGKLIISMDARFLINDGQHRKAAILEALEEDPTLGEETIPIVFFEDRGLERSQQVFTDLNKHAVKTSNSISELYDGRDSLAVVTRNVVNNIDFLNAYTDKETDNLGKYSSNLFTLNTFYKANKRIVKGSCTEEDYNFLLSFWRNIVDNIEPWQDLIKKEISKRDLREKYIVTQGVVIQALAVVGGYFIEKKSEMPGKLRNLKKIDWMRSSQAWKMRTIRPNGRIITNNTAIILTSNKIKEQIGLKLTPEEQIKETEFENNHLGVK